jgi:hypothetical protein
MGRVRVFLPSGYNSRKIIAGMQREDIARFEKYSETLTMRARQLLAAVAVWLVLIASK